MENGKILGTVVIVILVVLLTISVLPGVANVTTGITISHSRFNNATITFTPSANVTGSPGLSSALQLYPLFFAFIGLLFIVRQAKKEGGGI